eukprot:scaffold86274_cov53-Attheya_sp.AAC.6
MKWLTVFGVGVVSHVVFTFNTKTTDGLTLGALGSVSRISSTSSSFPSRLSRKWNPTNGGGGGNHLLLHSLSPDPHSHPRESSSLLLSSRRHNKDEKDGTHHHNNKNDDDDGEEEEVGGQDTIRVRIWQALADGTELSLSQLGSRVGERRFGDLKSHLMHVEKQAKTLSNKSDEWRARRGLLLLNNNNNTTSPSSSLSFKRTNKLRLKWRRGKKPNELYVRLQS